MSGVKRELHRLAGSVTATGCAFIGGFGIKGLLTGGISADPWWAVAMVISPILGGIYCGLVVAFTPTPKEQP